jgi:RimJ/RimL family protein N-acetyltransferase
VDHPPFRPLPVVLQGRFVRLDPIRPEHFEPLWQVAEDKEIWKWMLNEIPRKPEEFRSYFDPMLEAGRIGTAVPFAVIRLEDEKVVGSTRLFDFRAPERALEIGYTWYGPSARGTAVNPECKLLLLEHCFEVLLANRVQLKTDERNTRSQAAMVKMGARFEGILRHFQARYDGWCRNTAMFSIIPSEWPEVKAGLEERLKNF